MMTQRQQKTHKEWGGAKTKESVMGMKGTK